MKALLSALAHTGGDSPAARRPFFQLLRLAPAALLLCGLFTVWSGPLASPVAAVAALPASASASAAPVHLRRPSSWRAVRSSPGATTAGARPTSRLACRASAPSPPAGTTTSPSGERHGRRLGQRHLHQTEVPAGLSGVKAIAGGGYHSLALKGDGTVVGWGGDNFHESEVPAGLSGVTAIAAGGFHSLALRSDGTVVAWGAQTFGQLTVPPLAQSGGHRHRRRRLLQPRPQVERHRRGLGRGLRGSADRSPAGPVRCHRHRGRRLPQPRPEVGRHVVAWATTTTVRLRCRPASRA